MVREKHFMIDIETTGVDPVVDDLLELAVVEMDFVEMESGQRFWQPGKVFHKYQGTRRRPADAFAMKHMVELYSTCNEYHCATASELRRELVLWLMDCGVVRRNVLFCGWNAANFDVPFLNHKRILLPPRYEHVCGEDVPVGDHHYRVYEMCGAIQLAADVRQQPYGEFKEMVKEAYPMELPKGRQHDAVYDCFMQIKMLNGLIKILREGV